MSDLDDRLARALDEAVPQPPRELEPGAIRAAASAEVPRRRLIAPILAAAAVVVVAVGVLIAVHGGGVASDEADRPPGPPGRPSPISSVRHPEQITARAVERLLAEVPTLPGATPVDHAPVPVLRRPLSEWGPSNRVHRTRWWLASESTADALSYFTAHPPAGAKSSGSGSAGGPNGITTQGLSFAPSGAGWERPTVYTGLEVDVAVAAAPSGGVAVRIDVQAVWLPQRTPAEQVPDDVTSVDVVVDRNGSARTVRRALGVSDARGLARVVNGLPVFGPGLFHCPIMRGWTDTLTFHGPRGDLTVDADADGCQGVTVGPRSEHNPALRGGTVDRAVLDALGLPHNYGS